jgi:hypothetical protein
MGLIRRSRPATPRRRRRFSLNALAIQLSAFAMSFTLVALLVVAGSQAAFVEESEAVAEYVPIGAPADAPAAPRAPRATPAAVPSEPSAPPAAEPVQQPVEQPAEEPVRPPVQVPAEEPRAPAEEIELTDTDAGSSMFTDGTTLAPGDPLDRCIEVSYKGKGDPLPVRLYAASVAGNLAPYLDLTVEMGDSEGGTFGTCEGFVPSGTLYEGDLADFADAHPGYAGGLETWEPDGAGDARSFRFRVAVRDVPEAAGRSVSFGFTWETHAV